MTNQITTQAQPTPIITTRPFRQSLRGFFLRWEWLLLVLILIVSAINTRLSPYFLNPVNLFRTASDFIEWGLMMLPMVFIIITGNIDLSVASILGLSASSMGWLFMRGWNIWAAAGVALLIGGLAGFFNGYLITRVKLPSLVVTLGTFAFYRGLGFALLGDQAARGYPKTFTYIGQGTAVNTLIPFSLILFLMLAVIYGLVLHKSSFGRYLYAIGNNEEASRYSGVQVDRIKIVIFTLSGLMAAVAGIVMSARFASTRPDIGLGTELEVITATVLGGVDIFGGSGTIIGAVLSLCLIGIMRFGMGLLNIQGQVQGVILGILLISVILLPQLGRTLLAGKIKLTRHSAVVIGLTILIAVLFLWFFGWSRALVLAG